MSAHAPVMSRASQVAASALFAAAMAVAPAAWPQAGTQAEVDAALELYTARLSYAIARFRTAPPEGVTRYSEGVVQLRIDIGANGTLERQSMLRGSGDAGLDEHAQNILKNAVPQTAIPSGLRARPFYIAVTIDFSS